MSDELTLALENYGIDTFLEELGARKIHNLDGNVRSTCPVHGGDNGNSLSYTGGFFRCFADCDKNYSPISLIMNSLDVDYSEAKKYLSSRIGDAANIEYTPLSIEDQMNRNFLIAVNKLSKETKINTDKFDLSDTDMYYPALHENLWEEGFTSRTRDRFDLRIAVNGFMTGRIIIPIKNPIGDVIGIAGRSPLDNKTIDMRGLAKYKFSKGIQKSLTLYNYSDVIQNNPKYVIVVEGYKSVWRLYEWGYDNAIAIMGANVSDEQIKLLLKLNCPIIVSGDYDDAGKNMQREITRRLERFTKVKEFPIEKAGLRETSSIAEMTKLSFKKTLKGIL